MFWLLFVMVTGAVLDELELDELELELDEESAAKALDNPAVVIKNATDAILISIDVFFCII